MAVGGLSSSFPTHSHCTFWKPFTSPISNLKASRPLDNLPLSPSSNLRHSRNPYVHTVHLTHRTLMNRAKGSVHSHIPHNPTNLRMSMVRQTRLTRDGRLCARIRAGKRQFPDRIPRHFCDHGKRPVIHATSRFGPLRTRPH